jgi:hypothetical protein
MMKMVKCHDIGGAKQMIARVSRTTKNTGNLKLKISIFMLCTFKGGGFALFLREHVSVEMIHK